MFNRRKQSYDIDNSANNEQQALLNTPTDSINNAYLAENITTTAQQTVYTNQYDQFQIDPYQKPIPKPRKVRDTLPESNHVIPVIVGNNVPLVTPYSPSHAPRIIGQIHESCGDIYELSRVKASSTSVDCSSSVGDSHYKQSTSYIYYTIQPGDTLQNLSVKYSCPVASIKRLNNLWSDQEFFGLSRIKLPVGKLRLITDVIREENQICGQQSLPSQSASTSTTNITTTTWNGTNSDFITSNNHSALSSDFTIIHSDLSSQQSGPSNLKESSHEFLTDKIRTDSLFKNLDLSIERARTAARNYDDNASAIMQTLAQSGNIVDESDPSEAVKLAQREAETSLNNLSDFGLSYNFLLLFIFIICLVCPLAYVIYLEETHRDSRSHIYHEQTRETKPSQNYDDLVNKAHYDP